MEDVKLEKALEAIYSTIEEQMPDQVCKDCPVIQIIADIMVEIKKSNNERVLDDLGILIRPLNCPFYK